jgi:hypothetical protein
MRAGTDCATKTKILTRAKHKKTTVFVFLSFAIVLTHGRQYPMLIISRKKDQKIILAENIEITILEVGRNRVRFGVKAPRHIPIHTKLKGTEPEVVGVASTDGEPTVARVRSFSTVDQG